MCGGILFNRASNPTMIQIEGWHWLTGNFNHMLLFNVEFDGYYVACIIRWNPSRSWSCDFLEREDALTGRRLRLSSKSKRRKVQGRAVRVARASATYIRADIPSDVVRCYHEKKIMIETGLSDWKRESWCLLWPNLGLWAQQCRNYVDFLELRTIPWESYTTKAFISIIKGYAMLSRNFAHLEFIPLYYLDERGFYLSGEGNLCWWGKIKVGHSRQGFSALLLDFVACSILNGSLNIHFYYTN